jgi:transposase
MMIQRGKSYSQDLRDRVLAADDLPAREAASRFSVSPSYVIKARQRRDRSGVLTIKPRGHRRTPLVTGFERHIEQEVKRRPSATLADLRAWLLGEHGVSISTGTMWKTLRQLGLTLKKSRSAPPSKRAPTSPPPAPPGPSCSLS